MGLRLVPDSRLRQVTYRASKTCSAFHQDDSFVRGLMGPIGSGKSVACCWEIWSRAQAQAPGPDGVRRSRWVVVRNTYPELRDTTMRTWHDWFPKSLGEWRASENTHIIRYQGMELEVLFRALDRPDDVKKLLSLELTGGWVNEAREIPKSVVDMLQGRVGRYPSKRDGGPSWYGLIMDTNPPDTDHWWYVQFEEKRPAGWRLFRQPSSRAPDAENLENLPPQYYERMSAGKDDEWLKVYLHGDYGFVSDGRPVYPEWVDQHHVNDNLLVSPGRGLLVGLDFGLTPAAVIGQELSTGGYQILHELVATNMGARNFGKELGRLLRRDYPGYPVTITGDPAGEQRAQTDEETPYSILAAQGIDATPASTNDFVVRREAVAGLLTTMTMTGKPALQVHPRCRVLRKAMGGGYCYKRLQVSGEERFKDTPDKNNRFSHVADALQYLVLGAGEGDQVLGYGEGSSPYDDWSVSIN